MRRCWRLELEFGDNFGCLESAIGEFDASGEGLGSGEA